MMSTHFDIQVAKPSTLKVAASWRPAPAAPLAALARPDVSARSEICRLRFLQQNPALVAQASSRLEQLLQPLRLREPLAIGAAAHFPPLMFRWRIFAARWRPRKVAAVEDGKRLGQHSPECHRDRTAMRRHKWDSVGPHIR